MRTNRYPVNVPLYIFSIGCCWWVTEPLLDGRLVQPRCNWLARVTMTEPSIRKIRYLQGIGLLVLSPATLKPCLLTRAPSQTRVATKGYTLAGPTAPAVDQNGDLFIGGLSECSRHRGCANYRVPGDELGAQWQWKSHLPGGLGSLLSQRISLIVDRKNTVFVGLTGPTAGS